MDSGDADGQAAKLAFVSGVLPRLRTVDIPRVVPSWGQYWLVMDSAADAPTLLPTQALRSARPGNLSTLLQVIIARLLSLMRDPDFPIARPGVRALHRTALDQRPMFARLTSSASAGAPREPDLAREALNCVRVLTRVLPILYERASEDDPLGAIEHELFWTPQRRLASAATSGEDQFVLGDEEDADESGRASESGQSAPAADLPCLGDDLLNAVVDLLFVPGFTLPPGLAPTQSSTRIARVIWETGIGSTTKVDSSREQDAAKAELVRLLIVLCSPALYGAAQNRFLTSLVRLSSRKSALALLCSLFNVALAPASMPPATGAITRSLSSAAGTVPGIGAMLSSVPLPTSIPLLSRTTEHRRELGFQSAILLDLLLLGAPVEGGSSTPVSPSDAFSPSRSGTPADDDSFDPNVFRRYLAKLHRPADFDFLLDRLMAVIVSAADQGGLEGDGDGLGLVESLILLWRVIDCNPKFLPHILSQPTVAPRLLSALLIICLEHKDTVPPQQQASLGLIRLCVLLLQTLSAHRNFGARLNVSAESSGVRGASRGRFGVTGTMAEFLVLSTYTLVCSTQGRLASLYQSLVLILVNCAPYLKQLNVLAATRLVQLFLALSTPTFLLADENNPRLTIHMLECLNHIVHHQFSDNVQLIYAIIRSHRRFEELATFSLASAVADIRRMRAERRSTGDLKPTPSSASLASTGGNDTDKPPSSPVRESASLMSPAIADEEQPYVLSEKARGKMRARSVDEMEMSADGLDVSGLSLGGGGGGGDPGYPGPYTSRTGFVPTESWVASWRERLPLDTILIVLTELRPKIVSLCAVPSPSTNQAALEFLRSATMLGLLPPAPPIRPRPFVPSAVATRWLTSLVWGRAYVGMLSTFGGTRATLFTVEEGAASLISPLMTPVAELARRPFFGRSRQSSIASPVRMPSATV